MFYEGCSPWGGKGPRRSQWLRLSPALKYAVGRPENPRGHSPTQFPSPGRPRGQSPTYSTRFAASRKTPGARLLRILRVQKAPGPGSYVVYEVCSLWSPSGARILCILRVQKALEARILCILRELQHSLGVRAAGARQGPTLRLGVKGSIQEDEPSEQALARHGHASSELSLRSSSVPRSGIGQARLSARPTPRATFVQRPWLAV